MKCERCGLENEEYMPALKRGDYKGEPLCNECWQEEFNRLFYSGTEEEWGPD